MLRHPNKVVSEYDRSVMELLGVHAGQPWRYRDASRKIGFGKMKGIFRIYCYLGDALAFLKKRKPKKQQRIRQGSSGAAC